MHRYKAIALIITTICHIGWSQTPLGHYPDTYLLFSQNPLLSDPSHISENHKLESNLNHKMLAGELRDIASTNFSIGFNTIGQNYTNCFRASINNEQEGIFIRNSQLLMNYAIGIPLNPDLKIYTGINFGFTNIFLSAPNTNNSFWMPTGALGLGIKTKFYRFSLCTNQIFNNERNLYFQKRYFQTSGQIKKAIQPDWSFGLNFNANLYIDKANNYKTIFSFHYQNIIEISMGIKNMRSPIVGFAIIIPTKYEKYNFKFAASYLSNTIVQTEKIPNSLELYLGWAFMKVPNDRSQTLD